MGIYEKIVLVKNAVETLGYFSEQMAQEFIRQGKQVYWIDYDRLEQTMSGLHAFLEKGKTAFVTFNYIGLRGEEIFETESGESIWEKYEACILNMLVDHPMYYHTQLLKKYQNMKLFCLDREHLAYVKRFYPYIQAAFLPTAGNKHRRIWEGGECENFVPYKKRTTDIVFTSNYVPTALFEKRLRAQGSEYELFYRGIIEDLLAHPWQSADKVFERHIVSETGAVPETDLCGAMAQMIFIDQWVRSELRSRVMREVIRQGYTCRLMGADWDKFLQKEEKGVSVTKRMADSQTCIEAVANAKISLNILPWFRDGAHDRIFTAMLQKTVAVTDDSPYLRQHFTDGQELVYYSLRELDKLPEKLESLLANAEKAEAIAQKGYESAVQDFTWEARAKEMAGFLS